jgi:hypothetical protein
MERLVVSCMDRRLNGYLDSMNDGKTMFLRNAGGNVGSLAPSMLFFLNGGIRRIHVIVHTDCGAMKVIAGARDKSMKVSDRVHRGLVASFQGVRFSDGKELERANEVLQRDAATALAGSGALVTSELVDISKVAKRKDSGGHVLAVTRASGAPYKKIAELSESKIDEMYTVQANSMDEVLHDIEIATGVLGMHKVKIVELGNTEHEQLLADAHKLRGMPFLGSSVHVDYFKLQPR